MTVLTTFVGLVAIVVWIFAIRKVDDWTYQHAWGHRAMTVVIYPAFFAVVLAASYQVGQWIIPLLERLP